MASQQFALQVAAFAEKTGVKADRAVAAIAIETLNRVVLRSPVGNPELWASNSLRVQWNQGADAVNAELRLRPENLTKAGRLKRGVKIGSKAIGKPDGYVGGRFRGNWQVTVGEQPVAPVDLIDAAGGATMARGRAALAGFKAGPPIYLTNNVPYSIALEFGHSTQAPAGVVRITVAEFQQIVDEIVKGLP